VQVGVVFSVFCLKNKVYDYSVLSLADSAVVVCDFLLFLDICLDFWVVLGRLVVMDRFLFVALYLLCVVELLWKLPLSLPLGLRLFSGSQEEP
jgi:hypothetical protein